MVAALYRRYRPETFAELIGQSQVTDPLRTALRTDRVNHAYLFSGPRGCGKTTSARILARCLNCAQGPTDTPCGACDSCVELARDGGGSLDVVEIDAASHNGVDDARDLRERAVFAPARDRYKIFILDEAHMVTPQGFNALLKIVEEPPEHVKFIFATTEPDKVIGTIRSRTHHYPFRLVPPAQMLDYLQEVSESEKVAVEPGVLTLVVRAGGGSVRDTLSLLDQLMAGSEGNTVEYERAVALLGYTHGALLDEVIDAIGARDAAGVFGAIDRVIQTGQDPRRFVEDLLERLRDLIIVAATSGNAAAVLRGVPQDQLDHMSQQSSAFGPAELSRTADVVNAALSEMTGATSPRLHLELMAARILVPASDHSERGALARVERLERRVGVDTAAAPVGGSPSVAAPAAESSTPPPPVREVPAAAAKAAKQVAPVVDAPAAEPSAAAQKVPKAAAPRVSAPSASAPPAPSTSPIATPPTATPPPAQAETAEAAQAEPAPSKPVTLQQVKDAWPEILEVVKNAKLNAWMVVYTAQPRELRDGKTLVLSFPSQNDVDALKQKATPGNGVGDLLKKAFVEVLGLEPALIARVDAASASTSQGSPHDDAEPPTHEPPADAPHADAPTERDSSGWAVTAIPRSEPEPLATPAARKRTAPAPAPATEEKARYGESVVRELLGASFIEEQAVVPRVVPRAED